MAGTEQGYQNLYPSKATKICIRLASLTASLESGEVRPCTWKNNCHRGRNKALLNEKQGHNFMTFFFRNFPFIIINIKNCIFDTVGFVFIFGARGFFFPSLPSIRMDESFAIVSQSSRVQTLGFFLLSSLLSILSAHTISRS